MWASIIIIGVTAISFTIATLENPLAEQCPTKIKLCGLTRLALIVRININLAKQLNLELGRKSRDGLPANLV